MTKNLVEALSNYCKVMSNITGQYYKALVFRIYNLLYYLKCILENRLAMTRKLTAWYVSLFFLLCLGYVTYSVMWISNS